MEGPGGSRAFSILGFVSVPILPKAGRGGSHICGAEEHKVSRLALPRKFGSRSLEMTV